MSKETILLVLAAAIIAHRSVARAQDSTDIPARVLVYQPMHAEDSIDGRFMTDGYPGSLPKGSISVTADSLPKYLLDNLQGGDFARGAAMELPVQYLLREIWVADRDIIFKGYYIVPNSELSTLSAERSAKLILRLGSSLDAAIVGSAFASTNKVRPIFVGVYRGDVATVVLDPKYMMISEDNVGNGYQTLEEYLKLKKAIRAQWTDRKAADGTKKGPLKQLGQFLENHFDADPASGDGPRSSGAAPFGMDVWERLRQ